VEDTYIPIGNLYADAPIRCQTAGIIGNGYAPGQISSLIDVANIAYYDRCENIAASDKGAETATDSGYYNLMRESMDALSTAGARGSYIYHAKKVSTEIADVVANSPQAGQVCIYVLMKGGAIAGEVIKKAVYEACSQDDVRPLTDFVAIGDPGAVGYDIDFVYYIPDKARERSLLVESAVQAAVDDYIAWQCGKLGRDINPDELRQRAKAAGVKRIELKSPAFTVLRDGKDDEDSVPQIAAIGTVNIINGGYEDE
jgi:phage-related baseplate assembly protein